APLESPSNPTTAACHHERSCNLASWRSRERLFQNWNSVMPVVRKYPSNSNSQYVFAGFGCSGSFASVIICTLSAPKRKAGKSLPAKVLILNGADETRTRDLRRDRPAF